MLTVAQLELDFSTSDVSAHVIHSDTGRFLKLAYRSLGECLVPFDTTSRRCPEILTPRAPLLWTNRNSKTLSVESTTKSLDDDRTRMRLLHFCR
jgi:hypothetical protein